MLFIVNLVIDMYEARCKVESAPEGGDAFHYWLDRKEHYNPAQERYKNMLRLVAYDITSPTRWRKVVKVCKDYGFRVEYSVFECDLSESDFNCFWSQLLAVIDENHDKLIAYRICGECVAAINSAGQVHHPQKPLLYII